MTMSVDDYLSEWLECTEVKAALAYWSGAGALLRQRTRLGLRALLCSSGRRRGQERRP
jgi:hypothetical protein